MKRTRNRWFGTGRFQKYIRESTTELLRRFPEADGLEIYLWETPLLNDVDFFKGMGWLPRERAFAAAERWMSPAGMIAELLTAYARGAEAAGKDFMFLTFAHFRAGALVIDAEAGGPEGADAARPQEPAGGLVAVPSGKQRDA